MSAKRYSPSVLRTWRRQSGKTPEQVAVEAPISTPYLYAVENGTRTPTLKLLTRLAEVYGRDISECFTGGEIDADERDQDDTPSEPVRVKRPRPGVPYDRASDPWIQQALAAAPPLSESQRARLRQLLDLGGDDGDVA